MCRSRRELSKEYLLAKIGVDTAENEPLEVWGKMLRSAGGRSPRFAGGRFERRTDPGGVGVQEAESTISI